MKLKSVFKPDVLKVIITITISCFLMASLILFNTRFVPCLSKPLVSPEYELNVTLTPNLCSLGSPLIGVTIEFYWLSYLTIIAVTVLAPYLIVCLLTHYLQKPGKKR